MLIDDDDEDEEEEEDEGKEDVEERNKTRGKYALTKLIHGSI